MYIGNDLRSGRAEVFHYTSTSGGETAVTTASDGRSIRYDVGYCNVYLNGVRLHDSDYAATTGTSITNLAALSQNDVLIVEAPSTFSTTNTVPASGGSFTGPLTIDGGINQKAAAQDLSGTYANERMYINDLYSLKGDVNITGHLALGSISSGDIVITDDGNNREISGTGTLETGGILQERNTLLTGMTGELGSAVTGGSGLTAVPKVGVMTIKQIGEEINWDGTDDLHTANSMDSTGLSISNLTINANNKLLCVGHFFVQLHGNNGNYNRGYLRLTDGTNHTNTYGVNTYHAATGTAAYAHGTIVTIYHIFPYTSTTPTITLQTQCRHTGGNQVVEVNGGYSTMQLFEIQV